MPWVTSRCVTRSYGGCADTDRVNPGHLRAELLFPALTWEPGSPCWVFLCCSTILVWRCNHFKKYFPFYWRPKPLANPKFFCEIPHVSVNSLIGKKTSQIIDSHRWLLFCRPDVTFACFSLLYSSVSPCSCGHCVILAWIRNTESLSRAVSEVLCSVSFLVVSFQSS